MSSIKVMTFFSESHRCLFESYLLPTIPYHVDLIAHEVPQVCASGIYYEDGWKAAMYMKQQFMVDLIEQNMGRPVIYLDADMVIVRPNAILKMIEELGDSDMAFQDDGLGCNRNNKRNIRCAGCMAVNANQRTLDFFRQVKDEAHQYSGDQDSLNAVLLSKDVHDVLLSHAFWSFGQVNRRQFKFPEPIEIPYDAVIVHGNWTVGMENKKAILDAAMLARNAILQENAL
jgi:hypothetical protein